MSEVVVQLVDCTLQVFEALGVLATLVKLRCPTATYPVHRVAGNTLAVEEFVAVRICIRYADLGDAAEVLLLGCFVGDKLEEEIAVLEFFLQAVELCSELLLEDNLTTGIPSVDDVVNATD